MGATKPMSVNEWKRGAANRSMQFIQFASIDECMNEERRAQPAHFMKFNEMSGKRDVITVSLLHAFNHSINYIH